MIQRSRAYCLLGAMLALTLSAGQSATAQRNDDKKPSLSLRVTPPIGFSPLRVRVSVDVRGGADDAADFYCPTVEWDWDDDIRSQSSEDCEPYQAGRSSIQRRYSTEHTFQDPGSFTVRIRLKQGSRVVATASTNVQVRQGVRDDLGG
jgi:hypothetical protein